MKKSLLEIINNLSGNIFTLGIVDKELISSIQNNKKITNYMMLNINQEVDYEMKEDTKKVEKFNISKIKKKNKKKSIDYTICEISDCKEHLFTLINDTIYFNKTKIYYYGSQSEINLDYLVKKYQRYKVHINITKYSDETFILEIDTTKAKTNRFKGFIYKVIDLFELIFESLTNFLVS